MAVNTNETRLRLTAEDATGRGMASAARNLRDLGRQAEEQAKRIERAQQRILSAGTSLAGGLGLGVSIAGAAQAAKAGYVEFARFDRAMTNIGITSGASRDEMQKAGEQMKVMAKEFALPIDTMAEGLESLTASGKTLEQSLSFLPTVAATAQASGAGIKDIATSADALTNHLGITSEKMQAAMDILAAGGKAGKFELRDMAQYLPTLAPLAANIGYKGEEGLKKLVAILQVVRKGTGESGQAATATIDILSKFNTPEMQNSFREFGGDLTGRLQQWRQEGGDTFGKFLKWTKELILARAASEGGKSDPFEYLTQIFRDKETAVAMRALLSGTQELVELQRGLGNVGGTVARDLTRKQEDAAAASQRLANAMQSVTQAGGKMLDSMHVTGGLEWLADVLERAARGAENLTKLGFGGSMTRAFNIRAFEDQKAEYEAKKGELAGAKTPRDRERIGAEIRELEQRMEIAKRRIWETGTPEDRKALFPNGPPGAMQGMDPALRAPTAEEERLRREAEAAAARREELRRAPGAARDDAAQKAEVQAEFERQRANNRLEVERYKNKGAPGVDGILMDNPRGAQEDTQKGIKDGIDRQNIMLRGLVGPASYGGTSGGRAAFQRASYGEATTNSDPVGSGFGGSGVGIGNSGTGGGMGGTAGAPNFRYGGGGGGGGGSRRTPGGPGGGVYDGGGGGGKSGPGNGSYPKSSSAKTLTALIDEEAKRAGIDPRIMQGIRAGESGKRADYDKKHDAVESSWGPFQLNRRGGLGTEFERDTGMDVRDPRTIPAQVRWVANYIRKHGRAGLRKWMGYHGDRDADPRWGNSGYVPDSPAGETGGGPQAESGAGGGSGDGIPVKGGPNGQAFGGGETKPGTLAAARDAYRQRGAGIRDFTAFNDRFHKGTGSKHASGLAFDTVLKENTFEAYAAAAEAMRAQLREAGLSDKDFTVLDEKKQGSRRSTGPHLHTQFNSPEAAAIYNQYSARKEAERVAAEKAKNAPTAGVTDAAKARAGVQSQMEKPITVDIQPKILGAERLRDRAKAQSRREVDREVRDARLNTYSDLGVG